uniref:Uncharacterized protein n=1 Tax=Anguilla anguilla TaxID=7936 RepID=A0A0E9VTF1_ANGAN
MEKISRFSQLYLKRLSQ